MEEIECNKCGSVNYMKYGKVRGRQRYKCNDCKHEFLSNSQVKNEPMVNKIGITLNEFRERHDLNFIVSKAFQQLDKNHLYEKADITKLCNLRPGYPGLNDVLEQNKDFARFRGKVAGKNYWGHPEVIQQLKAEGQLT